MPCFSLFYFIVFHWGVVIAIKFWMKFEKNVRSFLFSSYWFVVEILWVLQKDFFVGFYYALILLEPFPLRQYGIRAACRLTCSNLLFPVENWTDLNAKKSMSKVVTKNTRRKRSVKGTIHLIARTNPVSRVRQNITEKLTRPTQMKGNTRGDPKTKKRRENPEN